MLPVLGLGGFPHGVVHAELWEGDRVLHFELLRADVGELCYLGVQLLQEPVGTYVARHDALELVH